MKEKIVTCKYWLQIKYSWSFDISYESLPCLKNIKRNIKLKWVLSRCFTSTCYRSQYSQILYMFSFFLAFNITNPFSKLLRAIYVTDFSQIQAPRRQNLKILISLCNNEKTTTQFPQISSNARLRNYFKIRVDMLRTMFFSKPEDCRRGIKG